MVELVNCKAGWSEDSLNFRRIAWQFPLQFLSDHSRLIGGSIERVVWFERFETILPWYEKEKKGKVTQTTGPMFHHI